MNLFAIETFEECLVVFYLIKQGNRTFRVCVCIHVKISIFIISFAKIISSNKTNHYKSRCDTPTNHSHAQPRSTPNSVNYFFPKRVYVTYTNAILSHIGCSFRTLNDRYMGIYFPRNFITTAKHVVVVEAVKYLGKYMTICLILACEKKQSICDKIAFLYFT